MGWKGLRCGQQTLRRSWRYWVFAGNHTDDKGAWLTDQLGDVYGEGTAQYKGGLGGVHINNPIVGIAAAASGQGDVPAASDGGAFAYGTQNFFGSVPGSLGPNVHLVALIVGIAVTHSGNGYWMVGADGGCSTTGTRRSSDPSLRPSSARR